MQKLNSLVLFRTLNVFGLGPQFVIQIPVVPGFFEAPQHQALDGLVQLVSEVSGRGDDG